jgi:transcriptional regulator with XRE-family HTH domain
MCEKIKKLRQFLKENNITQENAATRLGITVGAVNALLTGKRDFGRKSATAWADEFGLSEYWLMTGQGEMMLTNEKTDTSVRNVSVVNFDMKGGYQANEVVDMNEYAVSSMPLSSELAHEGDFIMQVSGDSMSPKFPAGCFVLLREVERWREYMELGLCYMLLLADGRRVIKEVRAGSDRQHVTLCSCNPAFDPVEISRDFILRVFMVVILIRKEIN